MRQDEKNPDRMSNVWTIISPFLTYIFLMITWPVITQISGKGSEQNLGLNMAIMSGKSKLFSQVFIVKRRHDSSHPHSLGQSTADPAPLLHIKNPRAQWRNLWQQSPDWSVWQLGVKEQGSLLYDRLYRAPTVAQTCMLQVCLARIGGDLQSGARLRARFCV